MAKKSFWNGIVRLCKMKIAIPIMRTTDAPDFVARASAVGLAWAMTPLIGVQMYLVFMTWIALKKSRFRFSLPIALAWTWVTNVVTMGPFYYLFYVTGRIMRGQASVGYDSFQALLEPFRSDLSLWESLKEFFKLLLQDSGPAMLIGCLPWAVLSAWLGYKATVRWLKNRDKRRAKFKALRQNMKNNVGHLKNGVGHIKTGVGKMTHKALDKCHEHNVQKKIKKENRKHKRDALS